MKKIFDKENIKIVLRYQAVYATVILVLEVVAKLFTTGITGMENFWFVCFIPAISLFFAGVSGILSEKVNRIVSIVLIGLITVYYCSQVVYFAIFDSFWSVSLLGFGGAAIKNFGGNIWSDLAKCWYVLIILFVPFAVYLVLALKHVINSRKFNLAVRLLAIVLVIPVWMIGLLVLRIGGDSRNSVYYAYANPFSDTDTTAERLGLAATTLVECGLGRLNYGVPYANILGEEGADIDEIIDTINNFPTGTIAPEPTAQPEENPVDDPVHEDIETGVTPTEEPIPADAWAFDIDFEALAELAPNEDIKNLCTYVASLKPTEKNDYTGMFEGYNLIYICAESFSDYAVNKDFTPTLYKLANNGIVLENYYNSFLNTTTNGEYAFATGLWPDVSRLNADDGTKVGSFPQSSDKTMLLGIGRVFEQAGAETFGFHNYLGSYYERENSWANLGIKTCRFMDGENPMVFTSDWITSDLEMMQQAVDDFIDEDRFMAYFMTFSGHGDYVCEHNNMAAQNFEAAQKINEERELGLSEEAVCYLAANMELDRALEYLLERLEEAEKLDNTVIVLAADHYPYFLSSLDVAKELNGGEEVEPQIGRYKSTCIIYNAAIKEPIINENYCSNIDILPTIFNLFNISFDSRLLAGRDVFAPNAIHKAVLYNKSFINEYVEYYAPKGETEWKIDTTQYYDAILDGYLSSMLTLIDSEYAASLEIMDNDFYAFIVQNAEMFREESENGTEDEPGNGLGNESGNGTEIESGDVTNNDLGDSNI